MYLLILFLAAFSFESWVPDRNPLSDDSLVVNLQPFVTMDSKVKNTKVFMGGMTIENLSAPGDHLFRCPAHMAERRGDSDESG